MSEDRENRGDGAAPPPTGNTPSELRDMIAESFKEQQERPPAAGGGAESSGAGAAPPPAEPGDHRGDQRPKPAEPAPGAAGDGPFDKSSGGDRQAPAGAGEAPAGAAPGAERAPAGPPKAPDHWSAEDKEVFGSLSSDDDRSKFLKLNARREAGLTPRLQRAADLERGYGEVEQLFQPWTQQLQAQNRSPKDVIKIWYDVERALTDKNKQDEVLANIIQGYGASPENIIQHLNTRRGFANPPPGAGDGQPNGHYRAQDPPPVYGGQATITDPVLADRMARLEANERARAEAEIRTNYENASRHYQAFADARDSAGSLTHPYLAEVEQQMTLLAQLDRAQGKGAIDLQDLYDRASWQNPSTRERLLADREANEARKAAEERKARSDAARRAGSSVTGAPGPGAAPQEFGGADRSIRDEIRAQMNGERR
jgi:hypothetical protein